MAKTLSKVYKPTEGLWLPLFLLRNKTTNPFKKSKPGPNPNPTLFDSYQPILRKTGATDWLGLQKQEPQRKCLTGTGLIQMGHLIIWLPEGFWNSCHLVPRVGMVAVASKGNVGYKGAEGSWSKKLYPQHGSETGVKVVRANSTGRKTGLDTEMLKQWLGCRRQAGLGKMYHKIKMLWGDVS